MTPQTPEQIAGRLTKELAKRDERAADCPLAKPRISAEDRAKCSVCGAGPSGTCGRMASADSMFVCQVRAILRGEI